MSGPKTLKKTEFLLSVRIYVVHRFNQSIKQHLCHYFITFSCTWSRSAVGSLATDASLYIIDSEFNISALFLVVVFGVPWDAPIFHWVPYMV